MKKPVTRVPATGSTTKTPKIAAIGARNSASARVSSAGVHASTWGTAASVRGLRQRGSRALPRPVAFRHRVHLGLGAMQALLRRERAGQHRVEIALQTCRYLMIVRGGRPKNGPAEDLLQDGQVRGTFARCRGPAYRSIRPGIPPETQRDSPSGPRRRRRSAAARVPPPAAANGRRCRYASRPGRRRPCRASGPGSGATPTTPFTGESAASSRAQAYGQLRS